MSGKSKEKSTQTTTLDPQYSALVYGAANQAQQLKDSYRPYAGPLVAGFNPTQAAAQQGLTGFAMGDVGAGPLGQAIATASDVAGYQPLTVSPQDIAAQQIAAGQLADTDLSPYLNPYAQNVIDTSAADIQRQREIALNQARNQALKAGAWGGTGAAVYQGQVSDNYDRNLASTVAQLRSQGYDTALQGAQFDIGARLTADQANQAAALAAAQANQSTALQAQQANQGAGLSAAAQRLQAAGVLGDFSDQQRAQALQNWGILSSVGDAQQAQQQKEYDAALQAYADELQQRMALAQLYNAAVSGVPQTGTAYGTKTTTTSPGLTDFLTAAGALGGSKGIRGVMGG